jgi:hypothetical protein
MRTTSMILVSVAGVLVSGALATGCRSATAENVQHAQTSSLARAGDRVTRSEVLARAKSWIDVGVPYCGALPGQSDGLCNGRTCWRGAPGSATRNAEWDQYRSDCSGFVSWAWGLAPPGLTTYTLPSVSSRIDLADVAAGDAFLNDDHTMLFLRWSAPGVAHIAEEPICDLGAREKDVRVSRVAGGVAVSGYGTFTVRRYKNIADDPPENPYEPGDRPEGGPFPALEIRSPTAPDQWITQCNESADGERVWQTLPSGPSPDARWASARYPQATNGDCGDAPQGIHPLVFRSLPAGSFGAWIVQCTGQDRNSRVFHAQGEVVAGHPAAPFSHYEQNASCP